MEIKFVPGVSKIKLDRKLLNALSVFERLLDIDITYTSGYRSLEEELKLGGSKTGSHLKGLAIDIACNESIPRYKIIFASLASGFKRIGIGKTHIHLDVDPDKPQPLIWLE